MRSTPSAFRSGSFARAAAKVPSGVNMRVKSWYMTLVRRKSGTARAAVVCGAWALA